MPAANGISTTVILDVTKDLTQYLKVVVLTRTPLNANRKGKTGAVTQDPGANQAEIDAVATGSYIEHVVTLAVRDTQPNGVPTSDQDTMRAAAAYSAALNLVEAGKAPPVTFVGVVGARSADGTSFILGDARTTVTPTITSQVVFPNSASTAEFQ